MKRLVALCALVVFVLALATDSIRSSGRPKAKETLVQLLAINDFHGNLQPPSGSSGRIAVGPGGETVNAGGVRVPRHLDQVAAHDQSEHHHGGRRRPHRGEPAHLGALPRRADDRVDERARPRRHRRRQPRVRRGHRRAPSHAVREPARRQRLPPGRRLPGRDALRRLALPVPRRQCVLRATENTIFPPYEIHKIGNAKIAFIGLTLEGTPLIVTPAGVAGLEFRPEDPTINNLVAELRASRACARSSSSSIRAGQNAPFPLGYQDSDRCDNFSGDIVPIVNGLLAGGRRHLGAHPSAVHLPDQREARHERILVRPADHGHRPPITGQTKDIVSATAHNVIVTRDVAPATRRRRRSSTSTTRSRARSPTASSARRRADMTRTNDGGRRVRARRRDRRRTAGVDLAGGLRRCGRRLHESGRHPSRPRLQQPCRRRARRRSPTTSSSPCSRSTTS